MFPWHLAFQIPLQKNMHPQRPTGQATNLGLPCMMTNTGRGAGTSLPQINSEDTHSQQKKHSSIWSQPEAKARTRTFQTFTVSLPENLVLIFHESK